MHWGSSVVYAVFGIAAAVVVMPTMVRRRSEGLMAQGRLECGMRVVDGTLTGLPRRWQHGVAQLGPGGQLTFRPFRLGLRPFPRPPVKVRVTSVVDPTLRAPGFPGVLQVAWYCRIIVLATETATVQVALVPQVAPWLLNHLVPWEAMALDPSAVPGPGPTPVRPAPTAEGFVPPS